MYRIPRWAAGLDIEQALASGLARIVDGVLVPVIAGAEDDDAPEGADEPLFALSALEGDALDEKIAALSVDELAEHVAKYDQGIKDVAANPSEFVSAEFSTADLLDETSRAVETLAKLKAAHAEKAAEAAAATEVTDDDAAAFAALAEAAAETPEGEGGEEPPAPAESETEEVTAAGAEVELAPPRAAARRRHPAPAASREVQAREASESSVVTLTAAAGAPDMTPGDRFDSELDIATAMIRRHSKFGTSGPAVHEDFTIARADWADAYSDELKLGQAYESNWDKIRDATKDSTILANFEARRRAQLNGAPDALVASGGLCAPVTPYYNLQFISVPDRPVMGALPSFNADRGGLRYATPAALSAVTDAVGLITEAEDAAGGSSATKSCQVIPCPPFNETDVDIIYHCLQFGNLGARAFPELVAQWNNLVLAAHARLAEGNLLTQIDAASTQVSAGALGLGASASLFPQILTAAEGMRSRNRMSSNAVLRLLLPSWAPALIVSDIIRSQFQRFETDEARVVALLRSFNIEPTFYIDSANNRAQVYGTQHAGSLLSFPPDVVWYLFPEASFLFLDGGSLELGIVRDSVLNSTNDFQIFGETFENVAFVGVESLAVVSSMCDTGVVSAPADWSHGCPYVYGS